MKLPGLKKNKSKVNIIETSDDDPDYSSISEDLNKIISDSLCLEKAGAVSILTLILVGTDAAEEKST